METPLVGHHTKKTYQSVTVNDSHVTAYRSTLERCLSGDDDDVDENDDEAEEKGDASADPSSSRFGKGIRNGRPSRLAESNEGKSDKGDNQNELDDDDDVEPDDDERSVATYSTIETTAAPVPDPEPEPEPEPQQICRSLTKFGASWTKEHFQAGSGPRWSCGIWPTVRGLRVRR
jgi:hypothetical protein